MAARDRSVAHSAWRRQITSVSQVELGPELLAHSAAARSGVRSCGRSTAGAGRPQWALSPAPTRPVAWRRFLGHGGCRALTARGISAGGAPGRTRTCDLEIRRLLLYPAELRGPGSTTVADLQHRQLSRRHPLDRSTPSNRFRSRSPDSPDAAPPPGPRAGDLGRCRGGPAAARSPAVHRTLRASPRPLPAHDIPLEWVGSPRRLFWRARQGSRWGGERRGFGRSSGGSRGAWGVPRGVVAGTSASGDEWVAQLTVKRVRGRG